MIAQLRFLTAIGLAIIAFGLIWHARWKWSFLAVLGSVTALLLLAPAFTQQAATAKKIGQREVLTVFCHNILSGREDKANELATIDEVKPDIVVILENTVEWREILKELDKRYPHNLIETRNDNFGIALFSRLPIIESKLEDFSGYEIPSTFATVEFAGRKVDIIGTHTVPPASKNGFEVRNWHLEGLARELKTLSNPTIVVGDFNITPWGSPFQQLLRETKLERIGNPLNPTWSAWGTNLLGVPIDHHLVSKEWEVVSYRVGDFLGSDHRWTLSELVLREEDPTLD